MNLFDLARQYAGALGVDPNLAASVLGAESNGNPNAVSPAGARGPMQLMPGTASDLGVDPNDPTQNTYGGVKYLAQIERQLGTTDPRIVAAAYNAGPGAEHNALAHGQLMPNYPETQKYAAKVAAGVPTMPTYANPNDFANGAVVQQGDTIVPGAAPQPVAAATQPNKYLDPADFKDAAVVSNGVNGSPLASAATSKAAPQPNTDSGFARGALMTLRGAGPIGLGAAIGGGIGAMGGGVGAVPGAVAGAAAGGLASAIGDPAVNLINRFAGTHMSTPTQGMENLADMVGIPRPANSREALIANVARAGAAAPAMAGAAGNAAGAVANPTVGAVLTNAAANPGAQMAGAATGSAAAQGTDQVLGQRLGPTARAAVDTLGGLAGGVAGAGAAGVAGNLATGARSLTPQQQQVIRLGQQYGIPLRVGDVTPGGAMATAENATQAIPGGAQVAAGTAGAQISGIRAALQGLSQKFRPQNLPQTAPNVDGYLASDLRNQYGAAQKATSVAFQQRDNMIAQQGVGGVQLDNARAAAQKLLTAYPQVLDQFTTTPGFRQQLQDLVGATAPVPTQVGSSLEGSANIAVKPSFSYPEFDQFSKDVGDLQGQAQRAFTNVGGSKAQLGAVKNLYSALKTDEGNWMGNQPQPVQNAVSNADTAYNALVKPFHDNDTIRDVVMNPPLPNMPDVAAQGLNNKLFGPQATAMAPYAHSLLSPDGRQAAAYQAIQDALTKATSANSPTGVRIQTGLKGLDLDNPSLNYLIDNTPGLGQTTSDARALLGMARRPTDILNNPKTGARLMSIESLKALGALGGTAAVAGSGHLGGSIDPLTAAAAAIGGGVAGSAGVQAASRALPKNLLGLMGSTAPGTAPLAGFMGLGNTQGPQAQQPAQGPAAGVSLLH